jgi:succinyl-CoA synthetase beta subunit
LATNPEEAEKGAKDLAAPELVVKAQIHAGGRGLGVYDNGFKGGVHLVKTPKEVKDLASKMLGARLKTKQTPPEGVFVNKLMVAASVDIKKEFYFAILLDRAANGPVMIASPQGGMDIEKVAEETPDLIFRENINIFNGPSQEQTKRLAEKLGLKGDLVPKFQDQVTKLYKMFISTDATQVEINPLAVVNEGEIYAVDAKLNFDDNAEFRHKNIFAMDDPAEQDPREVAAAKHGLNYVGMDGNIGCMVNGAGLAMATMDIIKLHQGEPANFLDVGGGADEARVTEAFKLITSDPRVKAILVNIFGGIVKCDLIAQGIINAYKQINLKIPVVVRLAGTNVDLGYKLLKESGLKMTTAVDLEDAAIKATAVLKQ